ncbi:MAG: dTMP kinase [Christensenellales bacterium]
MLPYDTVLFDLDGTLTESGIGITNAVKYALAETRVSMDEKLLKAFIGPPLYESFRDLARLSDSDARKAVEIYRVYYGERGWAENRVYTSIPRILRTLKQHGCSVFLATGKPRPFAERILDAFGLLQYFDGISAISLADRHADKQQLIEDALRGASRNACMVGDRKFDIEGANLCGIDSVGVLYGYGSEEELRGAGATKIAEDVKALSRILLGDTPAAKGLFISLEGTDGCGKTSQMNQIAAWLAERGWEVTVTREPGGCPISEKIRELLLSVENAGMSDMCEALLFAAARAEHVESLIAPAVNAGKVVLCDRFVDSSVAYQGYARGLGAERVAQINGFAIGTCIPDITLLFDVSPDVALSRRMETSAPDRIEREKTAFSRRVYEGYLALAEKHPDRIRRIDASGDMDTVLAEAKRALSAVL